MQQRLPLLYRENSYTKPNLLLGDEGSGGGGGFDCGRSGGGGWQDKDSGFSLGEYKNISLNFNPKDIPFKSDSYPPLLVPASKSVILENNIAF